MRHYLLGDVTLNIFHSFNIAMYNRKFITDEFILFTFNVFRVPSVDSLSRVQIIISKFTV